MTWKEMLFWMRSETYMSKINLQGGKLTVENRKSREKKRICSEVSVNSPGNPWSQSRRNGRLWWEDYRRWWVYDKIPYQVKHRAGDRGSTAENNHSIPISTTQLRQLLTSWIHSIIPPSLRNSTKKAQWRLEYLLHYFCTHYTSTLMIDIDIDWFYEQLKMHTQ